MDDVETYCLAISTATVNATLDHDSSSVLLNFERSEPLSWA